MFKSCISFLNHKSLQYRFKRIMLRASYNITKLTRKVMYGISLQGDHVKEHFDGNFRDARAQVDSIAKQLNLDMKQTKRFFTRYPLSFKLNSPENTALSNRLSTLSKLASEPGIRGIIGKTFREVLTKNRTLAFEQTDEHLEKIISTIETLQMTESQIKTIFTSAPNLINPKTHIIFGEKLQILADYLGVDQKEGLEIYQSAPFLLPASSQRLRQSLSYLLNKMKFSKAEVKDLMMKLGEVFFMGTVQIKGVTDLPLKWGLTQNENRQLFLNHPLLFLNYPFEVLPLKIKILKYLDITKPLALRLLKEYPEILIWSMRSLEAKAIFLKDRLALPLTDNTLEFLAIKYENVIKPRGDLIIKSKYPLVEEELCKLMKMSDEQFAQNLGLDVERVQKEKEKYQPSYELDFRSRKCLQCSDLQSRIVKLAQKYE